MKQLRDLGKVAELPAHTSHFPADRKRGAGGKWKGDAAGRMAMTFSVASERMVAQLECDQQLLSILADRTSEIGRVFGNSYVMRHGSYPR